VFRCLCVCVFRRARKRFWAARRAAALSQDAPAAVVIQGARLCFRWGPRESSFFVTVFKSPFHRAVLATCRKGSCDIYGFGGASGPERQKGAARALARVNATASTQRQRWRRQQKQKHCRTTPRPPTHTHPGARNSRAARRRLPFGRTLVCGQTRRARWMDGREEIQGGSCALVWVRGRGFLL
jgi:hypothetical protein